MSTKNDTLFELLCSLYSTQSPNLEFSSRSNNPINFTDYSITPLLFTFIKLQSLKSIPILNIKKEINKLKLDSIRQKRKIEINNLSYDYLFIFKNEAVLVDLFNLFSTKYKEVEKRKETALKNNYKYLELHELRLDFMQLNNYKNIINDSKKVLLDRFGHIIKENFKEDSEKIIYSLIADISFFRACDLCNGGGLFLDNNLQYVQCIECNRQGLKRLSGNKLAAISGISRSKFYRLYPSYRLLISDIFNAAYADLQNL